MEGLGSEVFPDQGTEWDDGDERLPEEPRGVAGSREALEVRPARGKLIQAGHHGSPTAAVAGGLRDRSRAVQEREQVNVEVGGAGLALLVVELRTTSVREPLRNDERTCRSCGRIPV